MGALVVLINVWVGMVFVPLVVVIPVIPEGGITVQSNVAPAIVLLNVTAMEVFPEQSVCGAGENKTVGAGFIVIVNVSGGLGQLFAEAITEIVAIIGEVVVFVGVNAGMLPFPLAGNPIPVLEFDHEYVVPTTVLVKTIGTVVAPLQYN